jgi:hypothetical protein
MHCDDCKFFRASMKPVENSKYLHETEDRNRGGHCCRYPEWREVARNHYCGEWQTERALPCFSPGSDRTTSDEADRRQTSLYWEQSSELTKLRKELKAKASEAHRLKKELREARRHP